MKAGIASPNGVTIADVEQPKPKPTDILVKVKAIALNRADLGSARGDTSHGASAGKPIGSEFSGEVVEAGKEVLDFTVGDRVMCHSPGSHAEFAVSDHGRVMKIPDGMSYETAATLPIGLNTLHQALITAGRMKAGENVMVQGASSGVGIIGLQIAKLMGAKFVVGTATNAERRARLKEFGADLAVNTNDVDWPEQVLKATDGKGVNLTVDMLSGPVVSQTMACTALLGRIVNIGRLAGMKAEFDFDLHARKRIDYIGVTFRTRTIEEVRDILVKMRNDLWDDVKAGRIKVPVDKTFPLAEAKAGHEHMRANKHFGKILLIP
jgi:NADPH:quinone reductase-like Zn-dependent oxidoreductase